MVKSCYGLLERSKSRDVFAEGTPVNKSGRPFSPLPSPFSPYHLPSQEERGKGR